MSNIILKKITVEYTRKTQYQSVKRVEGEENIHFHTQCCNNKSWDMYNILLQKKKIKFTSNQKLGIESKENFDLQRKGKESYSDNVGYVLEKENDKVH